MHGLMGSRRGCSGRVLGCTGRAAYAAVLKSRKFRHAEGGTRTRTGLRPLRPERSASTSSTTSAKGENLIPGHPYFNAIGPGVDAAGKASHFVEAGTLENPQRFHRAGTVVAV